MCRLLRKTHGLSQSIPFAVKVLSKMVHWWCKQLIDPFGKLYFFPENFMIFLGAELPHPQTLYKASYFAKQLGSSPWALFALVFWILLFAVSTKHFIVFEEQSHSMYSFIYPCCERMVPSFWASSRISEYLFCEWQVKSRSTMTTKPGWNSLKAPVI